MRHGNARRWAILGLGAGVTGGLVPCIWGFLLDPAAPNMPLAAYAVPWELCAAVFTLGGMFGGLILSLSAYLLLPKRYPGRQKAPLEAIDMSALDPWRPPPVLPETGIQAEGRVQNQVDRQS